MKISWWIAGYSFLGLLTCLARGGNINGEATYISFSVPNSLGTYPMSINASMTVTGYYRASPTRLSGFLRDPDGTITPIMIPGAVLTVPESINAAGNVTGFYTLPSGDEEGFLRYAGGRIVTFYLPGLQAPAIQKTTQPISINDYDDIAGNHYGSGGYDGFVRSASGILSDISLERGTTALAINANGAVLGLLSEGEGYFDGFVLHPDGWESSFYVPFPPVSLPDCPRSDISITFPEAINAAGTIVGWYTTDICGEGNNIGFVASPDGVYTSFQVPGTLAVAILDGGASTDPRWLSIDEAGDVAGSYLDTAGVQHGFVRNPYGTITSFDPPEGNQTTTTSMSSGGAIAGFYRYKAGGGPPVAFIRVP